QVNLALGVDGGGSGRQPGSSFKPIVAATALEAGRSFDDTFESSPAQFTFPDGSSWNVQNAEGGSYGMMSLHEAMVHSVNGVYARLAIDLGPAQIATQAQLMGVESDLPAYPSIALGAAEVSVLDMASAYSTLANNGTAIEPTTIRSIRLSNGEVIKPEQEETARVLAPGNAYLVTKVLQDVIRRGTGRAAYIGRPAAGKTGTTNDYADAWFVGYTPDLVAAVWVGYPEGRIPMLSVHGTQVLGGTYPAAIWRAFMLEALGGVPREGFKRPASDLVRVSIDPASGLLAASWCPGEYRTMLRQQVPTEYCPEPAPEPVPTPIPAPVPSATTAPSPPGPSPKPSPRPSPPEPSPKPSPAEPTPSPDEPEPTPDPSPSASVPAPNPSPSNTNGAPAS
ncbi:MAG: penicillin-binding transpeptidase domain-containing protein, partial [Gemmatimonadota bacterium]|nr:penicillin-binding transpeptidase domain-containing protein [Gemmatimonadota bacterium]